MMWLFSLGTWLIAVAIVLRWFHVVSRQNNKYDRGTAEAFRRFQERMGKDDE